MNSIFVRTNTGTIHHEETYERVIAVSHDIGFTDSDGNKHVIVALRLDSFNGARFTPVSDIWQGEYIGLVIACLTKAKEVIAEFQAANQN